MTEHARRLVGMLDGMLDRGTMPTNLAFLRDVRDIIARLAGLQGSVGVCAGCGDALPISGKRGRPRVRCAPCADRHTKHYQIDYHRRTKPKRRADSTKRAEVEPTPSEQ